MYPTILLNNITLSVQDRIDRTDLPVYTIDPEGCTDADDGFSIEVTKDIIHLFIHIADPTEYFSFDDEQFACIIANGVTHYPSGHKARHMFPKEVIEQFTLIDGNKHAITVHTELDKNLNILSSNIEFTKIHCDPQYRFSYEEASIEYKNNIILEMGFAIYNHFYNKRDSSGKKLTKLNYAYPKHVNDTFEFGYDNVDVKNMKNMIGEFAIHANKVVAEYIYKHRPKVLFVRSCEASELKEDDSLSAHEFMNSIIENGIQANYEQDIKPHDLVGVELYTHFTSPLRRCSDCIVHFLIKSINLGVETPFNSEELKMFAHRLNRLYKNEKKLQFNDIKFRLIQCASNLLDCDVDFKFKFNGYTGLFINIMITQICDYNVSISYVLRKREWDNEDYFINNPYHMIKINRVNVPKKFDEGTFEELDNFVLSKIEI